jgi:integrase/recombinase XerD
MIEDMTLRNLAPRTIPIYVERVATFAQYFNASPQRLGPDHIRAYLLHLVQERHLSWTSFNQTRAALRFLYRVTLAKDGVSKEPSVPSSPVSSPSS